MSFELRPSSNEAFAERIMSAQIRRQQELNDVARRPRASDKCRAKCMREIEIRREVIEIERQHREVWD